MQGSSTSRVEKFSNSRKRAMRSEEFTKKGKDNRKRNKTERGHREEYDDIEENSYIGSWYKCIKIRSASLTLLYN